MERAWIEYIINALWQIPLLASGAWLLLRALRAEPLMQHRIWLAVLALAVLLPLRGIQRADNPVEPRSAADVNLQLTVPVAAESPAAVQASSVAPETPAVDRWRVPARVQSLHLTPPVAHCVAGFFLALVLVGFIRLALGWQAARQLVQQAEPITLGSPQLETLHSCCQRLGVNPPQVRESSAITSPVLVGALAPVLLLPPGFEQYTTDQIKAALCHELAHLRRHDYMVNLICQLAALPVSWHPVTAVVHLRVRRTREMICDAIAAQEMRSELCYAKCLLALAQSMLHTQDLVSEQALGLFSNNTLEERVMRLMENKSVVSVRTRMAHIAAGATAVVAAVVISAVFHLTPVMAQSPVPLPPLPLQHFAPAQPPMVPQAEAAPVEAVAPAQQKAPLAHHSPASTSEPAASSEPIPEASARIEQQVADALKQLGDTKFNFDSPEFKHQMEEATRRASEFAAHNEQLQKKMAELQKRLQSDESKRQFDSARRDAEFAARDEQLKKQMAGLQKRLQSEDFQRQVQAADLARNAEFQKQMAELQKHFQSEEFQKEIQKQLNNGELKQQMEKLQKQLQSGQFKQQMEKAMQSLKEAQEQLDKH